MTDLVKLGINACQTKITLQGLTSAEKDRVLTEAAADLRAHSGEILAANLKDMENGRQKGMSKGLLDRLLLTEQRIHSMAEGMEAVANLPDCIGELIEEWTRPNGLHIQKVRVPLGVIGVIYESRPNVTADVFALCFKSGNAVILKGGSDAYFSNKAIVDVLQNTLNRMGLSPYCLQMIEDTSRETALAFMKLKDYVDVLIPRGSAGLIKSVVENSTIPVIETGTGNCHVYVDETANLEMAADIIINAKTQRVGVCNACESLVVHKSIEEKFLPVLEKKLQQKVELRADERAAHYLEQYIPASEEDYRTEYLDYILSIKTVDSLKEAIEHINRCNTKHSECIVTEDKAHAAEFLKLIDASCVYWNASTRFTDGYEFGFGAEIGISTQMLHARGPMGLREITSYKYIISGNGQVRG